MHYIPNVFSIVHFISDNGTCDIQKIVPSDKTSITKKQIVPGACGRPAYRSRNRAPMKGQITVTKICNDIQTEIKIIGTCESQKHLNFKINKKDLNVLTFVAVANNGLYGLLDNTHLLDIMTKKGIEKKGVIKGEYMLTCCNGIPIFLDTKSKKYKAIVVEGAGKATHIPSKDLVSGGLYTTRAGQKKSMFIGWVDVVPVKSIVNKLEKIVSCETLKKKKCMLWLNIKAPYVYNGNKSPQDILKDSLLEDATKNDIRCDDYKCLPQSGIFSVTTSHKFTNKCGQEVIDSNQVIHLLREKVRQNYFKQVSFKNEDYSQTKCVV